jgi:hypothetical protein
MKLVHRFVVATVLAWCPSTDLAVAEPISITSGVTRLTRDQTASMPMTLWGTDGVRSFAFSGLLGGDSGWGAHTCDPCRATATDFSIDLSVSPSFGDVTYGSEGYRVPAEFPEDPNLYVSIRGRAPLPPSPPAVGDVATVTAPFTMTGALFPPFGGRANTLVGSGVATLDLRVDPFGSEGPVWGFRSGEYRFTDATSPAPVPEPATILLCGSGLALAVLRRRRKANGPHT